MTQPRENPESDAAVLYLRVDRDLVQKLDLIAELEGSSRNDVCERWLQDRCRIAGADTPERHFRTGYVAKYFSVSPATVRKWLNDNQDLPVLHRGRPSQRVPWSTMKRLEKIYRG